MIRIELTEQQAETLTDLLHNTISDLGMEIAATELLDFREQLKRRRQMLHEVLDRLQRTQSKTA